MYMRQILHPSIFYTHLIQFRVKGVTGACPSCHWARGVVRPWQVASNFQGQRKIYSCKKKKGRSFPNTKYPKNSNWTEWTTGPHPHVEWRSSETLVISLLLTSLIYHFLLVVCVLLHVLVRLTRQLEKGLRVNVSFLSFPVLQYRVVSPSKTSSGHPTHQNAATACNYHDYKYMQAQTQLTLTFWSSLTQSAFTHTLLHGGVQ